MLSNCLGGGSTFGNYKSVQNQSCIAWLSRRTHQSVSDRQTDEQTDGKTDDGEEMPVPIPAAGDAIIHGKVCKTTT